MRQTAVTNPGTNLIGFIDPLTGLNAEQMAFAQIGVSLAFAPVVQYKSPAESVQHKHVHRAGLPMAARAKL